MPYYDNVGVHKISRWPPNIKDLFSIRSECSTKTINEMF